MDALLNTISKRGNGNEANNCCLNCNINVILHGLFKEIGHVFRPKNR